MRLDTAAGEGLEVGIHYDSLLGKVIAHGPDRDTHALASDADLKPYYLSDTLAFMFETRLVIRPTRFAMETPALQRDYDECWSGFQKFFRGT